MYTVGTAQKLRSKKLASCWTGLYQVVRPCGLVNVEVKRCVAEKTVIGTKLHVNKLKPYIPRTVRPPPCRLEITRLMVVGGGLGIKIY